MFEGVKEQIVDVVGPAGRKLRKERREGAWGEDKRQGLSLICCVFECLEGRRRR